MNMPTNTPMSPAQAAHHAKVSRRTIMRAISSQELKAFRDNKNYWKIACQDLETWASAQCAHTAEKPTPSPPDISSEALELAIARAENNHLRQQLKATETDRDHWRSMAEKLIEKRRFSWPWKRRT